MPTTSLLAAGGMVLAGLLLLYLPGYLAARVVNVRGLSALAVAPALTLAALGATAVLTQVAGKRWGPLPALVGLLAMLGVALVLRALGLILREGSRGVVRWQLPVGVLAGGLLAVTGVWIGAGSPDAFLQRWDAVFHLSALRLIEETGSASSLTLGALSYGTGEPHVYPAGWHAFASLLPGASPTAVLTVAGSVTSAAPWVVGVALLARTMAPTRPAVAVVAAVAAGAVTPTPMSLWVGWGHLPNAAAFALVPGLLAFVVALLRGDGRARTWQQHLGGALVLLATAAGVGVTHPNALLALLVLTATVAVVVAVGVGVRAWRNGGGRVRALATPLAVLAAAAVVLVGFVASPLAASVTGYVGDEPEPLGNAVARLVLGRYELWPHTTTIASVVLAPLGAVLAWREGTRWAGPVLVVAWALYADAALGGPLGISALWYTSPARISVVVATVTVPLGAVALTWVWTRLWSRVSKPVVRAAGVTVLVVAVATLAVTSTVHKVDRSARVYGLDADGHARFVTAAELDMIAGLDLDPTARVLGSPFSGSTILYALFGQPVVFPVAGQVWSEQQHQIMDNLDDLTRACPALDQLGVRYLYQDTAPYQASDRYDQLDAIEVPGATVVAEAGTARVLALPPCT